MSEQPNARRPYGMPSDPLMAMAWVDAIRWAISEPECLAQFTADTGITYSAPRSPLERMIDDATGQTEAIGRAFVDWFNANVWGEGDADAG